VVPSPMFTPSTVALFAATGSQSESANMASVFSLFCGGNLLFSRHGRHSRGAYRIDHLRRLAGVSPPGLGPAA
jgi:hypothetical protein